jgi:hypothetical protein
MDWEKEWLEHKDYDPKKEWFEREDYDLDPSEGLRMELGFCGCVCDDRGSLWLFKLLALFYEDDHSQVPWDKMQVTVRKYCGWTDDAVPPLFYMAMTILDNLELVEHGTAIRCSWITPKGRRMVKRYESLLTEGI